MKTQVAQLAPEDPVGRQGARGFACGGQSHAPGRGNRVGKAHIVDQAALLIDGEEGQAGRDLADLPQQPLQLRRRGDVAAKINTPFQGWRRRCSISASLSCGPERSIITNWAALSSQDMDRKSGT